MFELWLNAYEKKARNPGNTVIATMNPVFDHLSHCYKLSFFGGFRSFEVIIRSNAVLVATAAFPGFLSFV